ncbi:MAG: class I SAM-dependent DNA methyltransferase [bacterium]
MSDFDKKAKEWDNDPEKLSRAKKVAEGILDVIDIDSSMTAFEYGCGTGLLSFQLKNYFKKIVLADISQGMLNVLNDKIEQREIENMESRYIDLTEDSIPEEKFNIIYTLMTLHHINDLDIVFNKFFNMLKENGYICIADLVKEDGSFHGDNFDGHNGFEKEELEELLEKFGFNTLSYKVVFERKKMVGDKEKTYPIFLLIVQKS